jgi:hypothetical protein
MPPASSSGKPSRAKAPHLLDRLLWLTLATGASLVLLTASQLTPSPTGVGTHTALGLPACGFLAWSGLPCPACGLTTSFAHLARANLSQALAANPMGLPLFALTATAVALSLLQAYRGTNFLHTLERVRADRAALLLVLALLLSWAARLLARSRL